MNLRRLKNKLSQTMYHVSKRKVTGNQMAQTMAQIDGFLEGKVRQLHGKKD